MRDAPVNGQPSAGPFVGSVDVPLVTAVATCRVRHIAHWARSGAAKLSMPIGRSLIDIGALSTEQLFGHKRSSQVVILAVPHCLKLV